jgi:hypothetical protein
MTRCIPGVLEAPEKPQTKVSLEILIVLAEMARSRHSWQLGSFCVFYFCYLSTFIMMLIKS